MKHILLCTTSFPDDAFADGQEAAGSFVADFAQALAQHVTVTVVTPSKQPCQEHHGNLRIHRFAVPSLPLSLLKPQNPAKWGQIVTTLRAGQQAMWEVVDNTKIDHIFALWALPSGYWARTISKKTGIPYSIWALGSDIWGLGKVPVIRSVLRQVLQDASHCFADGYLLAEDTAVIGQRPCDFLPSTRKLNVPYRKTLATAPPYKLAFLGRWHPNKGADLLLNALSQLRDEDWENITEVRYCGGGPLEDEVKTAVAQLQQADHPITLQGYLNPHEATDLYQWADYLLIPSRIESIPVIFSDAMQTDCPIITTPVGDLPRLVKEFGVGILAEEATAVAFANAMLLALQQQPAYFRGGFISARAYFDIEKSAKTILNDLC